MPGIPVEFAFDARGMAAVQASSGETVNDSGAIYVSGIKPGVDSSIDLVSRQRNPVHLVVLTAQEAEDAWKVHLGGSDHLIISAQDFFADPDAQPARIWLRSRATPQFDFKITSPFSTPLQASLPLTQAQTTAHSVRFTSEAKARKPDLQCRQVQAAGDAPPVRTGPAAEWRRHGVAQAPSEAELHQAAKWSITLPPGAVDGLSELFLEVRYQGDVARLYATHRLLADDFYNGQPWSIGLRRFLDPALANTFDLSILPLHANAPIYFEIPGPPNPSPNRQIEKLEGISLVPEYELVIDASAL